MQKTEIQAAWKTTKRVSPFIWPVGDTKLRARVVLALLALIGSIIIIDTTIKIGILISQQKE